MKIVITGATGFVGGAMMRYFSKKGHHVIGLGRNKQLSDKISKYGTFKEVDIRNPFTKIEADVCIHAAGLASDKASFKDLFEVNVQGTKNVFEQVICNKFIHISSSSVYNFDQEIQSENDSIDIGRLQNYGKSKRQAELFLEKNQSSKKSITILRPRAIYGIGDRILFPRIVTKVKNDRLILPGHLNVNSSLTHIDNLIEATEVCMNSAKFLEIYNVADREDYNLRACVLEINKHYFEREVKLIAFPLSMARMIAKLTSSIGFSSSLNKMAIDNLSKNMVLDTKKLHNIQNYNGNYSFFESIQDISEWLRLFPVQNLRSNSSSLAWAAIEKNI